MDYFQADKVTALKLEIPIQDIRDGDKMLCVSTVWKNSQVTDRREAIVNLLTENSSIYRTLLYLTCSVHDVPGQGRI